VIAAVAVSGALLLMLTGASVMTDRALASLPLGDALHIELTAHQFWWEATYDDPDPSRMFSTANEVHVPVGRAVVFTLQADDVIHSLWVPNLHGKKDLIPGRSATLALRADQAGVYRGQCAEFCGYQHANMALFIVAEPPEDFAHWADHQRESAPSDISAQAQHGRDVFTGGSCALCHAVQGTSASARRAPDLTHVASRMTLAAGTLPNTPAHRAAWVMDPNGSKPGVNMPPLLLSASDMSALLAYLDTLR
jgi:cytochrome c oxidase subunit 2